MYLYVLRGFYALRDTRTPFFINLVENGLTLLFAFVFVRGTDSGVQGLAWAWSLAYAIAAVVAFVVLRRRIGPFGLPDGRAHHRPGVADGGGHRGHGRGRLPDRRRVRLHRGGPVGGGDPRHGGRDRRLLGRPRAHRVREVRELSNLVGRR